MRISGILAIVIAVLIPVPWFWALSKVHDPGAIFSQYLGSVALILMGISQLMSTRWRGLELIFGGLDRIYVLHKWIGIIAITAVLLHDTVDAEVDGVGRETLLSDFAETLGEISLYGFLVLIVLSIATFVPYHLWKYTHKLMGAFFAASAFHFAFILRPFELSDPAGLYVLGFCFLGIICYVYTLIPYGVLQGRRIYEVTAIEKTGDSVAITLNAQGNGIRHRPGQFAFVSFLDDRLGEPHPFTISSARKNGELRFTVKRLGNFTSRLASDLTVGALAKVSGGFGHFERRRHDGKDIWIAGGIGITPFAAFTEAMADLENEVHLFHCVRDGNDAPHRTEMEAIAETNTNFYYHLIESSKCKRLEISEILEITGAKLSESRVYFCGSRSMRLELAESLQRQGLRDAHFYFEEFEIRSGIGLRKLLSWLLSKLTKNKFSVELIGN